MERFWLLAQTTQKLTRFAPFSARSCSFTAAAARIVCGGGVAIGVVLAGGLTFSMPVAADGGGGGGGRCCCCCSIPNPGPCPCPCPGPEPEPYDPYIPGAAGGGGLATGPP